LIRLGCEVPRKSIFYSSGEDTGVPSGKDLNSYVRQKVADASIVVAIISPAFQTRPFCIAELGAAWSVVGRLFPIAVPGMERPDLEGVLRGLVVKHLDDSAALDELHTRVSEALGDTSPSTTWGQYKAKWLASLDEVVEKLPTVRVVTSDEFERAQSDLAGTQGALSDSEKERRKLEEQVGLLAAAKSPDEVAEIMLPQDEVERFEHLCAEASSSLRKLDRIVTEAMWYDLFEDGMPWPSGFEDRLERAEEARRDGTLIENSDERLVPDYDVAAVSRAAEAVDRLRKMLNEETTEEFEKWFYAEYGMNADLRKKALWDKLLG
jgi:hypothetical protein